MTDTKPKFLQCAAIQGARRTAPAELERRKSLALELLRAGVSRKEVSARTKLEGAWVKRIAEEHGIARITARAKAYNRVPDDVRVERERKALALLRAGHPRGRVGDLCSLSSTDVRALAEANGIPKQRTGPRMQRQTDVTRMTHAQLDALERRVAEERAPSRWRPAVTVLRSEPAGGAYVDVERV